MVTLQPQKRKSRFPGVAADLISQSRSGGEALWVQTVRRPVGVSAEELFLYEGENLMLASW